MRLTSMDGVRGVAALWVVLVHAPFYTSVYGASLITNASAMLSVFFIGSGFAIGLMYGERMTSAADYGRFALKRLGRLWPLHVAALAILAAMETARWLAVEHGGLATHREPFSNDFSLDALVDNLLLIHAWGWRPEVSWNAPSWTVSTEFAAYLVFCGICLAMPRLYARLALAALCAALAGALYYVEAQGWRGDIPISATRTIMEFLIGFLVWFAWKRFPLNSRIGCTALELAPLALALAIVHFEWRGFWTLGVTACFALMTYAVASGQGVIAFVARAKPLVWLGGLSYAIYLLHVPIFYMMTVLMGLAHRVGLNVWQTGPDGRPLIHFGSTWATDLAMAVAMALIIGVAVLANRWIEAPARIWSARAADRLFGSSGARAQAAAGESALARS